MSTIARSRLPKRVGVELHDGDRMSRAEFHRAYEQMPDDFRAELIGGMVHVPSPVSLPHGTMHPFASSVFAAYASATPGMQCGDNPTVLLGDESEPQPDLYLRILPDYGGQSRTTDDYVEGAPELVAEIAYSTRAIDLHRKLDDYRRCGVLEYIVLCLREPQVRWFDFRSGQELALDGDGVLRSRVFPGLWIDTAALVAHDHARLTTTLQAGLATPEHADFVQRLAAQRSAPRT